MAGTLQYPSRAVRSYVDASRQSDAGQKQGPQRRKEIISTADSPPPCSAMDNELLLVSGTAIAPHGRQAETTIMLSALRRLQRAAGI